MMRSERRAEVAYIMLTARNHLREAESEFLDGVNSGVCNSLEALQRQAEAAANHCWEIVREDGQDE